MVSFPLADQFLEYDVYIDNASPKAYAVTIGSAPAIEVPANSHVRTSVRRGVHKASVAELPGRAAVASHEMALDEDRNAIYIWNRFGATRYSVQTVTYVKTSQ
ncbi:MAG: hypothetical protein ACUVX9_18090 [Anaerolineae bacterium]